MALCGGSQRFRAQLDRWMEDQAASSGSMGTPPVLRVPLDCPEQLPAALSAVRFMYTGKLDVSDAASLLRVRRQAAYLQVEGGAGACEEALVELIAPTAGQTQQPQNQQQLAAGSLSGVAQLYGCREHLSSTYTEPAVVRKLLHTCRQQLVEHSGAAGAGGQQPQQQQQGGGAGSAAAEGGGPSLGQLLVWVFGDAPSLLSEPEVRRQALALPAAALEALLGCEEFATDDEASVLLLVLTWLRANAGTTAPDTRQRLIKLVRLTRLGATYLLRVLPLIFFRLGISPAELRFLQEYALASEEKRRRMAAATAAARYDLKCAWYAATPRPTPCWDAGPDRTYEWSVDAAKVKGAVEGLQGQPRAFILPIGFTNGSTFAVTDGFEWSASIHYDQEAQSGGLYLTCALPAALGLGALPGEPLVASTGSGCCLEIYEWQADGSRRENADLAVYFDDDDHCQVGNEHWGTNGMFPLRDPPSPAAGEG